MVHANDLNPRSHHFLEGNIRGNKVGPSPFYLATSSFSHKGAAPLGVKHSFAAFDCQSTARERWKESSERTPHLLLHTHAINQPPNQHPKNITQKQAAALCRPYNLDARQFLRRMAQAKESVHHLIMNLPASSLDFLGACASICVYLNIYVFVGGSMVGWSGVDCADVRTRARAGLGGWINRNGCCRRRLYLTTNQSTDRPLSTPLHTNQPTNQPTNRLTDRPRYTPPTHKPTCIHSQIQTSSTPPNASSRTCPPMRRARRCTATASARPRTPRRTR